MLQQRLPPARFCATRLLSCSDASLFHRLLIITILQAGDDVMVSRRALFHADWTLHLRAQKPTSCTHPKQICRGRFHGDCHCAELARSYSFAR